jgi:hypothetical protein
MNKISAISSLGLFLILGIALPAVFPTGDDAGSSAKVKTLILYDAASGAVPGTPLMGFTGFPPGVASPIFSNDATILDTTSAGVDTYAGWTANETMTPGFPVLERTEGFRLDFTLQIENESHNHNHRSGFNLILLSDDARGIELAFWENEIWVQSDSNTGELFQHGEGIVFPTTAGLINYQLTVTGDAYTLIADTRSILTGPVRDYSDFDGFPDPYQTPNFIFLGDDTTSAQARIRLRFVSITGTEPVTATVTTTGTGTSEPLPTASPAAISTLTPALSSPTPISSVPALCPAGGLILAILVSSTLINKTTQGHIAKRTRSSRK